MSDDTLARAMSAERDEAAFAAWWYTELKAPRHPESAEDKISEHVARAAWEAGQAAARAEVARLRAENHDLRGQVQFSDGRAIRAEELYVVEGKVRDAEVARLRDLLRQYGAHDRSWRCPTWNRQVSRSECTCGWAAARREVLGDG